MISLDILKTFAINKWQQGHQPRFKAKSFFHCFMQLVCFQKLLLGQEPMFVQIKWSRLFLLVFFRRCCQVKNQHLSRLKAQDCLLVFFLEVVVRLRTSACPDQMLKTLCWFFFKSCYQVKNQCLSRSRAQYSLMVFFFKSCCQVNNQCLSKSSGQDSLLVFFLEVVVRLRTNVCPYQAGKTLCWFVFKRSC